MKLLNIFNMKSLLLPWLKLYREGSIKESWTDIWLEENKQIKFSSDIIFSWILFGTQGIFLWKYEFDLLIVIYYSPLLKLKKKNSLYKIVVKMVLCILNKKFIINFIYYNIILFI